MISMSNITPLSPAGSMRVNKPRTAGAAGVKQGQPAEKFDKVTLSAHEGEDPIKMERTATTTGTLANLRREVQSGQYQVDARSIAKKLLLMGEV